MLQLAHLQPSSAVTKGINHSPRLNTSPTERTPPLGFQSYLPAMTRASPLNLSERVPASLVRAAYGVCGAGWAWNGATLTNTTIASVHVTLPIRNFLICENL